MKMTIHQMARKPLFGMLWVISQMLWRKYQVDIPAEDINHPALALMVPTPLAAAPAAETMKVCIVIGNAEPNLTIIL